MRSKEIIFLYIQYIQPFCTLQQSCLDKPPCVNHKEKKIKPTKGAAIYLSDTGSTWRSNTFSLPLAFTLFHLEETVSISTVGFTTKKI